MNPTTERAAGCATEDATEAPLGARIERQRRRKAFLVARVCALAAEGHGLAAIARRRNMPRLRTLRRWLDNDDAFRARYERARAFGYEVLADDVVAIADAATGGSLRARLKLRIDARKWRVALLDKQFGSHGGEKDAEASDSYAETIARLERAQERIRRHEAEEAERDKWDEDGGGKTAVAGL